MPTRIQRRRTKGARLPEGCVCVSRPSRWGNPFKVGVDGDAAECVRKFEAMLFPYRHGGSLSDFYLSEANLEAIRLELRGKDLACWCPLTYLDGSPYPCHATRLLEIAND